ncbi:MAG: bifunctional NAD(P)H-hydrate repair enzyme Nnr [Bacteroidia bacterium]|nr:MAG: bifunctional NAD(P)H-hydrate repair enzyme Nnr [Bacteroidia bacterium]
MYIALAQQIQESDKIMTEEYAYPSLLLMETAGRASSEVILNFYPDTHKFLILCGPGNNGGDGMVVARYLHKAGRIVKILFALDPNLYKGDSSIQFQIIKKSGIPYSVYDNVFASDIYQHIKDTIIIDALLGTGTKEVKEPITTIINQFRTIPNSVIAIDLPSGLNPDTGFVTFSPLKCELTIALQLPKICHYVTPASNFCGEVRVVDIGIYQHIIEKLDIPYQLITKTILQTWYKPRLKDTHKGNYGHVYLAGGSKGKAGAIALASRACIEVGAGLTTAFIPSAAACAFHRRNLEGMSIPYGMGSVAYLNEPSADVFASYLSNKSVVAIGPGLGNNPETYGFMKKVLPLIKNSGLPLILDADAINIIADHPELWNDVPPNTIFTPHPGEMSRLLKVADIQNKRLEYTLQLAKEKNIILVLKGAGTIIATPEGKVFINGTGNPGMATAGAGDVLTGVIAGLVAQGYSPKQAAIMGVAFHAKAGDIVANLYGIEGVSASKIMRYLGPAIQEIIYNRKPFIQHRDEI